MLQEIIELLEHTIILVGVLINRDMPMKEEQRNGLKEAYQFHVDLYDVVRQTGTIMPHQLMELDRMQENYGRIIKELCRERGLIP